MFMNQHFGFPHSQQRDSTNYTNGQTDSVNPWNTAYSSTSSNYLRNYVNSDSVRTETPVEHYSGFSTTNLLNHTLSPHAATGMNSASSLSNYFPQQYGQIDNSPLQLMQNHLESARSGTRSAFNNYPYNPPQSRSRHASQAEPTDLSTHQGKIPKYMAVKLNNTKGILHTER